MIEAIESRRMLSATALLTGTELNVAVTSAVNTTVNVTYADGKISVYVQDQTALRRVYLGARKAINTINVTGSAMGDKITLGEGIRATIVNSGDGNDVILGNSAANTIYAGNGNDSVLAGGGDDVIYGGYDKDTIYGGEGNDQLYGESGVDSLLGEAGDDLINGGVSSHADYIYAGVGKDSVKGGAGRDYLYIGSMDEIDTQDRSDAINLNLKLDKIDIDINEPTPIPGGTVTSTRG